MALGPQGGPRTNQPRPELIPSSGNVDKAVVMGNFYIQPIGHLRDLVALDLDPAHAADAYGSWF